MAVPVGMGVLVALGAAGSGVFVGVGVAAGAGPPPHAVSTEAMVSRSRQQKRPASLPSAPIPPSSPVLPSLPPVANIRAMSTETRPVRILPSILSADFARLGEQVREAEEGGADAIHIDVMDGRFVPNISVGPLVVEAVRRCTVLPLHVHLMIEQPRLFVTQFVGAGADVLIVHQEGNWTLHRLLEDIKGAGASPGVALNPATPVSHLEEVAPYIDMVLAMTVEPGFGGQSFIPSMYDKIARLRHLLDGCGRCTVGIEVDGGVNLDTAGQLVTAGADMLVAGSAVFACGSPVGQAIAQLRAAARST